MNEPDAIRLEFIAALNRSLRSEIMEHYGNISHDLKSDKSVVTEIDKSVERKITTALQARYPDIGFVGEEFGQQGSKETYWLIDPIDGTESYIRGLPGVTTIIGLVHLGEVIESYIYDPTADVMYSAVKGQGVSANGQPVAVSARTVESSIVAMSSGLFVRHSELACAMSNAGVFYSAQYYGSGCKAIYLAAGKIDGVVIFGGKGGPWDYAPTAFMMKESGAICTPLDEAGLGSGNFAMLNPQIHDKLIPIIKEQLLDA